MKDSPAMKGPFRPAVIDFYFNGTTRTSTLDTYQRLGSTAVTSSTASHVSSYDYAGYSRLGTVTIGTKTAAYAYLADSDAIETLTFKSGTSPRLATTRSHDSSGRLDGVTNTYGSAHTESYGVAEFDLMNRRKKITREDGTCWNYGYNSKGEVLSGIRAETASPNTPVPGWNYGYAFDEIGNRNTTTTNGRVSTYSQNALNQYDRRTNPRAFDRCGKYPCPALETPLRPSPPITSLDGSPDRRKIATHQPKN